MTFMFNQRRLGLVITLLLWSAVAVAADSSGFHAFAPQRFLKPDQAFSHQEYVTRDGHIQIYWRIAEGYYLYRSRMTVTGVPAGTTHVEKPQGQLIDDPYFGRQYIYAHDIAVTVSPGQATKLKLTWQGCAKAGLCYPPEHDTIEVADLTKSNM